MRRLISLAFLVAGACSPPPTMDAGTPPGEDAGADAGPTGPACATSRDCKLASFDGACRDGHCTGSALCTDDVECGLGENCLEGACRFTGCTGNADCATGACRMDVFTCAECGKNSDCPTTRPVCDTASNTCVQCKSDAECTPPGPGHCDAAAGACVHCLEDKHCPNGLSCGAGHLCTGAKANQPCPMGIACDSNLVCVGLGGVNTCLPACNLSSPLTCKPNEICYKLTFSSSSALVFDNGGPLGVCYLPQNGLRGYRESCVRSASSVSTSNCQPNLVCVPDAQNVSLCRAYCDLQAASPCPAGEKCHPFRGDQNGRLYGVCYPDNGWGDACFNDAACKPGLACSPYEDPSAADKLAPLCQFAVGTAPGLAPCGNTPLPDAGVLPADKVCASGQCAADPLASSVKFFCYSACKTNADCSVGGRTGLCDGDFVFPAVPSPGKVKGCRPACTRTAACNSDYGNAVACRSRYTPGYGSTFFTSCAPQGGTLGPGAACTSSIQCRSGFCLTQDGRGVSRKGVCAEACETGSDCAAPDAGSPAGPLACSGQAFLGFQGFDGLVNTYDDVLLTAKLCNGGACTTDDDCGVDAGIHCVPDADPADAGKRLALRCRPNHATGILSGTSPCSKDEDCASGVCGTLQSPSTGTGKACFQACNGTTACPGSTVCRAGGMRVLTLTTNVSLDSCAP